MNDTYKIHTNSPMGSLEGTLKLSVIANELVGNINLGKSNYEFRNGRIDSSKFYFEGVFKFYLKKIKYTAEGELVGNDIRIMINTNMGGFKIEGYKI